MSGKPSVGKTKYTEQTIQNFGFDENFKIPIRAGYKYNRSTGNMEVEEGENLAVRVAADSGDSNVEYIGQAAIGAATDAASWQIMKVDKTSGTIITWADSNEDFDNVWNNREALSYG